MKLIFNLRKTLYKLRKEQYNLEQEKCHCHRRSRKILLSYYQQKIKYLNKNLKRLAA